MAVLSRNRSPPRDGALTGTRAAGIPLARLRRFLFFLAVTANAVAGIALMFEILRANGMTALEWAILGLFAITYTWIASAMWSALVGFVLDVFHIDPLTLRRRPPDDGAITTRTAIVMPVHNEDPERALAGLEATWRSVVDAGLADHFDAWLLSDSTDDAVAAAEARAWQALRARAPRGDQLYYRHREDNMGRKPGNLADFCCRWGGHYEHMVGLDADSVMTGTALAALVRAMQASPEAGLIQTVPLPTRQVTFFGRFTQFAARLISPMLARGFSFWQLDSANYWGHNAIVRMRAFTEACGLPSLPGHPPLGGEILSHDFVEAALLRRAGWYVYLRADIGGSYEEVPSNILDFAARDRRWAQGNLQHLRVLPSHGLHPINRLHFVMGATAFLSSLFWLFMLLLSTVDAISVATRDHQFFGAGAELFPNWPIIKTGEIFTLLAITGAMLVLPKILGLLLALGRSATRRGFGGGLRLIVSAVIEIAFSVLIAPIMMCYHSWFVLNVLAGRTVKWSSQARAGRAVAWREALRRNGFALVAALAWGGVTYWITPVFFWWLMPVIVGLVLAPAIVVVSSDLRVGRVLQSVGLFAIPEETQRPRPLAMVDTMVSDGSMGSLACHAGALPDLPRENRRAMPAQSLRMGHHWRHWSPASHYSH